jgi:hypothetical protein
MVYRNILDGESWLFDSRGEWNEEGVNHPELSLDKNFNEIKYYDNLFNP